MRFAGRHWCNGYPAPLVPVGTDADLGMSGLPIGAQGVEALMPHSVYSGTQKLPGFMLAQGDGLTAADWGSTVPSRGTWAHDI
jgi:hypothetical protein